MVVLAVTAVLSGCGPTAYKITPIPASEELAETTVRRDPGILLPKIALVDIEGLIVNARESSLLGAGENPTALAVEKLRKAATDPWVKAVVLRINSPGGSVTASDIIYHEVARLRNGADGYPGKPVIAQILDVGASGGYYVACAANEIRAEPTSVTGSIGVIMLKFDVSGLFEKVGVDTNVVKSGPLKDAGSPFRPMEPREREMFQHLIDQFYEGFVAVVAASRADLKIERVKELANGAIYSGLDARELGLIDGLGSLDEALDRAKQIAGVDAARVVMYHRPVGYRGSIYSRIPDPQVERQANPLIDLRLPEAFVSQGHFMYLWQP